MKTVPERLAELRKAMAAAGCSYFIMPSSDPHSSEYAPEHYTAWEYFSGFSCENANLIVGADEAALWVDGRFFGAADAALAGTGVDSMHMGVKGVPTVEEWLEKRMTKDAVLGYCAETMPIRRAQDLDELAAKLGAKFVDLPLVDQVWTEDRPALPATPAWILSAKYAGKTPEEKLAIYREKLAAAGCTAGLVTTLDAVAWLLNLRASDVDCTPYALAFCYVDEAGAVLFMDHSRLCSEGAKQLAAAGVKLADYDGMPAFLAANTKDETVLVDPKSLNAALALAVDNNSHFTKKELADPIALLKAVKNDTELACTKTAHIRDAASMVRFQMEMEQRMAAGETLRETDIDVILHKYRGSDSLFLTESFPTIAAWGPNAAMMHYAPKVGADAEIERHGYLLVDSGATYYDGTTDITRTFAMGPLTDEEKIGYTRVLRCHIDIGMAVWKAGATGGELDMIARQAMWRHMLDYRCGTGHGVGHVGAVHEGPQSLRPHNDVEFLPGMVITDEPGIYTEGSLGVRIENEMLTVEAGESEYGQFLKFEPLMYVPIDLTGVLLEELTSEEKEWLNWYHGQVVEKVSPLLNAEEKAWLAKKCAAI